MKTLTIVLSVTGAYFLNIPAEAGLADVQAIWQLNDSLDEQSGGSTLTANGFTPVYADSDIGGTTARVMDLPALTSTQTLGMPNNTGANGGPGALATNNWTIVMDINLKTSTGYTSLVQTNQGNINDVDIFVRPNGALDFGPNVTDAGRFLDNTWYRLALSCRNDGNDGALSCIAYIDGVQTTLNGIGQIAANGFNGTFSLDPIVNLFSDNSDETDDLLVNSMAFWGEGLSGGEIATLGGATATGIEIPSAPKICPSNLLLTSSGNVPNPQIDLVWSAASGLDSTGIEVLLDNVLIDTLPVSTTSYTHEPTVPMSGAFESLTYTVQMTGGADSANCTPLTQSVSYFTGELTADLVAYLPLDADGTDFSGRSNNGTISGVPDFGTGKIANAMTLADPATPHQYAYLPSSLTDLQFGVDVDFTVSVWVNNSTGFPDNLGIGGSGADPAILSNKDWNAGGNIGWIIAAAPDGHWQWNMNTEGGARADYDGPAGQISDGVWHHLMVSHDRDGDAVMYFDGTQVTTRDISAHTGTIDAGFGIGVGTDGAEGTGFPSWFTGAIDEVAIWRRVVTPEEVSEIHSMGNSGTPLISPGPAMITGVSMDFVLQQVFITFDASAGAVYQLEGSSNLIDWSLVKPNIQSIGEETELLADDSQITFPGARFYRLRK